MYVNGFIVLLNMYCRLENLIGIILKLKKKSYIKLGIRGKSLVTDDSRSDASMHSILSQMKVHNKKCHWTENVNFSGDADLVVVFFYMYSWEQIPNRVLCYV